MYPHSDFFSGMITMGYFVASAFFFRFWVRTSDALFIAFSVSFLLLAISAWITPLLLGESYANAAPVLDLLAGSAFLTLATNPAILLLFPLGEVRLLALVGLAQLAIRVGLNLWLMPTYGATGAAGAELLAKVVTLGLALVAIDRILRARQRQAAAAPTS